MKSKIAEALHLQHEPVAVYRTAHCPEGALQFKEGVWGCVVGMLNAAAKGRVAAMNAATVACRGGKQGLGLQRFTLGTIEYFLSVGGRGDKPGEHYKKTPELAREYVFSLPEVHSPDYVVFAPLSQVSAETPELVVFLVNADQFSGLATLANYDRPTQDNVQLRFGAGCAQAVLYGLDAEAQTNGTCFIGLTDPSARKVIDKDRLSFSIPMPRFLEMEANADSCFFHTDTWAVIEKRL